MVTGVSRAWIQPRKCRKLNPSFFAHSASFGEYGVSASAWSVKRPYGFASNSIEGHVLFDYDVPNRLKLTQDVAELSNRKMPRNMESSQLMCYTNIWALSRVGASAAETFWNRDYKDFDGLQAKEGGMIKLLHPSLRGTHPGASGFLLTHIFTSS